ncbi:MAG: hypothetical protein H7831_11465 [Magnetococcus sp. WYHC-3]
MAGQGGQCWQCGVTLDALQFGFRDLCPQCAWETHCCANCRFYDTHHYNDCREPQAERVVEKEKGNYCDYFEPGSAAEGGERRHVKEDAIKAAQALFKI